MPDLKTCLVVVVVVVLLYNIFFCGKDGLVSRPDNAKRKQLVADIMKNVNLFYPHINLEEARTILPWMDAITFDDLKKLKQTGKLLADKIEKILS